MNEINAFASAIDCIMHVCVCFYINAFYFYVYDHGARLPNLTGDSFLVTSSLSLV